MPRAGTRHIEPLLPPSTARYWVGGSASWDATAGTKWSTSPGGIGGASVPTQDNDVYFTSQSGAVTCTVPTATSVDCRSLIFTGFTGTFKMNASTSVVNIYGPTVTFVSGMTVNLTNNGLLNFVGSGTQTLTGAARVLPSLTRAGSGTLVFADNATTAGTITLTSGTLNANSKSPSCSIFNASGTTARTLTLGTSGVTCTSTGIAWNIADATNLTVTANTGTAGLSGAGGTFLSDTVDYNGMHINLSGSGAMTVDAQGSTFNNVIRLGTAVKTDSLVLASNLTLTGVAVFTGNTILNRLLVCSNITGTARTITNNGGFFLTGAVDFMDITGAGSASWDLSALPNGSGDCGGNSGITFTTAATQTATGTAGFTWSTHGWTTRVPLPQDNVIVPNSFVASQGIIMDMPRSGKSLDFSGCTGSPLLALGITTSFFGSFTMAANIVPFGTGQFLPAGRGSYTFTSAGAIFSQSIMVTAPGGTYTFTDDITTNSASSFGPVSGSIGLNGGTAIFQGNVTFTSSTQGGYWHISGTTDMGPGTWSFAGTSTQSLFSATNTGVDGSDATLIITSASTNPRTLALGDDTFGTVTYTVAGSTGSLLFVGSPVIGTLNFSDASNGRTLVIPAGEIVTVTNFNVVGTSGKLMAITSGTPGVQSTLSKASGIVSADYLSIIDSIATGGAAWFAGTHSTNAGNNTGWSFVAPPVDSDSGTGTETWSIVVTLSDSDSGSGLEDSVEGVNQTDAGSGSDAHSIAVALSSADTGTGVEDQTIFLSDSDTGSGVDAQSIAAALTDSDTGAGLEDSVEGVTGTDSGSGTDAHSIAASFSDSDSGTGVETESIAAALSGSDTGSGADDWDLETEDGVHEVSDDDEGTGVEDQHIYLSDSDSATGVDSEAVAASLQDSDSASSTEAVVVAFTASDSGTGTDAQSIAASLSDNDTGSGLEDAVEGLTGADAGFGSDDHSIAVSLSSSDSGTAVEAEFLIVRSSDTGSGTEDHLVSLSSSDSGTGVDTFSSIVAALSDSDAGFVFEVVSLSAQMADGDSGTGTDAGSVYEVPPAPPIIQSPTSAALLSSGTTRVLVRASLTKAVLTAHGTTEAALSTTGRTSAGLRDPGTNYAAVDDDTNTVEVY